MVGVLWSGHLGVKVLVVACQSMFRAEAKAGDQDKTTYLNPQYLTAMRNHLISSHDLGENAHDQIGFLGRLTIGIFGTFGIRTN
ncbi:hypothetical protein K458DRAFT_412899 [Lentithecium fluviatile CBS 122367]|uniref:Uncharacterized protein n=1 Tax=Lentithecium fluviatile CBS 122367 TaxID=1168545 RepID=A0A6G1JIS0_9PLEO|nr:hypothetical protein K458DRAFT_412899 [Lentithecium fluviatile CBS 122367]